MQLDLNLIKCFVARPQGDSHELLLLLRSPGRFMAATWQIVTGGIEPNESAPQAALRELREETGLTPVEFFQVNYVSRFYLAHTDRVYLCPCFCAIVAPGAPVRLNAEHDDCRWFPRETFESHLMWPDDRIALREVFTEILGNGPSKPFQRLPTEQDSSTDRPPTPPP